MNYARADLSRLVSPYRSKAEEQWSVINAMWVGDWFRVSVIETRYEPLTFHVPGGTYTPDFMNILEDGRIVFVEVKGSKAQKNYRDARSKLRAVRELYPWFYWCEARPVTRGAWEFEEIK